MHRLPLIFPADFICGLPAIFVCPSLSALGLGWSAAAVGLVCYYTRSVYATI